MMFRNMKISSTEGLHGTAEYSVLQITGFRFMGRFQKNTKKYF